MLPKLSLGQLFEALNELLSKKQCQHWYVPRLTLQNINSGWKKFKFILKRSKNIVERK